MMNIDLKTKATKLPRMSPKAILEIAARKGKVHWYDNTIERLEMRTTGVVGVNPQTEIVNWTLPLNSVYHCTEVTQNIEVITDNKIKLDTVPLLKAVGPSSIIK
jgi:hypothetical protein